jgi:signal transduction histidine kinase
VSATTLVSRVARVQTAVSVVALAFVVVGTLLFVEALLVWKTDHHLLSTMERAARYLDEAAPGTLDWQWFADEVEEVRPKDVHIEVRDSGGQVRVRRGAGSLPAGMASGCKSDGSVRGCTLVYRQIQFRAARDRKDDRDVERQFGWAMLGVCLLVGAGVALTSRAVTRRAVEPLYELSAYVEAVEPGVPGRSSFRSDLIELAALARRFDDLIERFDTALAREKRFSAEASHELRTPLTVARGELEALALTGSADKDAVSRAIVSVDRLSSLVDSLLWFARAQGRLDPERLDPVNLADVVRAELSVVERVHSVRIDHDDLPDEALVMAEEELLRRAVANLLENAAKHGSGTRIRVELARASGRVSLAIANGGEPIPTELREHVFEPFFRHRREPVDAPGFGLGLPFARAVARAHGGELEHGRSTDRVVEMVMTLPLVDWHDA